MDIDAVIFDDDTAPKLVQNIRADRSIYQSPIDNAKNGIVNLGSEIAGGPAVGCRSHYATIGGGEGNNTTSTADYACVPGGRHNYCRANYTFAVGNECQSNGVGSFTSGDNTQANGSYSLAQGYYCTAGETGSIAFGSYCVSNALYSVAIGYNAITSGAYSAAIGWNCDAKGVSSYVFGRNSQADENDSFAFGQYAHSNNIGQFSFSGFLFSNALATAQKSFQLLGNSSNNGAIVRLQDTDGSATTFVNNKTYFANITLIAGSTMIIDKRATWTKKVFFHTSGSSIVFNSVEDVFANNNTTTWNWNVVNDNLNLELYFTGAVGDGNIRALACMEWIELQNE